MCRQLALVVASLTFAALAADPPLDLKLRLRPGTVYRIETTATQQITQTVTGRAEEKVEQVIGYALRLRVLDVDQDTTARIAVTYDSARLRQQRGDQVAVDYDSARQQGEIPVPAVGFAGLVGVEFEVRLAASGALLQVTVPKDAVQSVRKRIGNRDGATNEMVEKMLAASLNEKTVGDWFRGFSRFLPERPVAVGDSWRKTEVLPGLVPMRSEATWTLKARENGLAIISVSAKMRRQEPAPAVAGQAAEPAEDLAGELTGEEAGIVVVKESTGLVQSGTVETTLRGTVDLGGGEPGTQAAQLQLTVTARVEVKGGEVGPAAPPK